MKKVRCKNLCVLILLYLLPMWVGCAHRPSEKPPLEAYRVVTQIDVVYHKKPIVSEGSFSDPEKMQKILFYLRRISPYGMPADDPEQSAGSDFYITLRYSDNTQKTYQQRDDRFMRIDSGPWKRIDPKEAVMLSQILGTMESDEPAATEAPFLMPTE